MRLIYSKYHFLKKSGFAEAFVKFAKLAGAQVGLEIISASCWDNPQKNELAMSTGGWSDRYGTNHDYTIAGLKELLGQRNESISKLVVNSVRDEE